MHPFFEKYKSIAIDEYLSNGILPSITLTQAALESNYGNSYLAINANNLFGIKCGVNWNGETIRANDDSPNECFRKYESIRKSFKDHSDFLRNNKRYNGLFNDTNFDNWADELQQYGYATNPNYSAQLKGIYNANDLRSIDEIAFKKKEQTQLQSL